MRHLTVTIGYNVYIATFLKPPYMTNPKLDRDYPYMLRISGNTDTLDIRKLVSIKPIGSSDYWSAKEYQLVFNDGTKVLVARDDIENTAILDDWYDTV